VSKGNWGGWSLLQEEVEVAVFLGNRGARRCFTAGFSNQGPALASPLKVTDREKLLNYMRDPEADHMATADSNSCPVSAGSARDRQRRWDCNRARSPRGPRSRAEGRTQWVGHACAARGGARLRGQRLMRADFAPSPPLVAGALLAVTLFALTAWAGVHACPLENSVCYSGADRSLPPLAPLGSVCFSLLARLHCLAAPCITSN
jgi:hypothetical protein